MKLIGAPSRGWFIVASVFIFLLAAAIVLVYIVTKDRNKQKSPSSEGNFETVFVDFDQPGLLGSGWYPPERSSLGMSFQWTTGRVATLDLPFQSTDSAIIEFCVVQSVANAVDTLKLEANGQPVDLFRATLATCPYWFSGHISHQTLARSPAQTTLTFLTDVVGTGDSVAHNGDMRQLSVSLDWLKLRGVSDKVFFTDFDRPAPGTNWYDTEVSPKGITYQWTSDRVATLEVYIQTTSSAKIEFCVVQSMLDAVNTLKFQVNGQKVMVSRMSTVSCPYLFTGEIPQEILALNPDKTELTFLTDVAELGENIEHNGDMRRLSVALDWLKITSLSH